MKLIKEEKSKIYETIIELKNVSDYYRNLCDIKEGGKVDAQVNTEDLLSAGVDAVLTETEMQTESQEDPSQM